MVLAKYGENTELDEDASGNTVIRNTATGTEVLLADFVDNVGSFGSAANRIDGESFFDQLNANSVETSTVIDSDDATSYDVGDDLASGAFSDGDNNGTYTLPNPSDGIEVGSVNTQEVGITTPGGTDYTADEATHFASSYTPIDDDSTGVAYDGDGLAQAHINLTVRAGSNSIASALLYGNLTGLDLSGVVAQDGDFAFDAVNSDVTGTTGTDGNISVSFRDGMIEIENRSGSGIAVSYSLIG